jgi:hypothetical protein
LIKSVKATLPFAHAYILFNAVDRRGRAMDEVPQLLAKQLPPEKPSEIVPGECEAITQAWRHAQPGDRLVLICDYPEQALATLQLLAESIDEDQRCVNPRMPESVILPQRGQQNFPGPHGISQSVGKRPGYASGSTDGTSYVH